VLDDDAWREDHSKQAVVVITTLWRLIRCAENKVWIGHDTNYLYFAFQCDDPDRRRSRRRSRDATAWADDWVGVASTRWDRSALMPDGQPKQRA
jgi:hypothetical protein